jgi:hypothetical protein
MKTWMHACVSMRTSIYSCMHVYCMCVVGKQMCMYLFVCVLESIYAYVYVYARKQAYMHVCTCKWAHTYACVCMHVCVCMYICAYVCMNSQFHFPLALLLSASSHSDHRQAHSFPGHTCTDYTQACPMIPHVHVDVQHRSSPRSQAFLAWWSCTVTSSEQDSTAPYDQWRMSSLWARQQRSWGCSACISACCLARPEGHAAYPVLIDAFVSSYAFARVPVALARADP